MMPQLHQIFNDDATLIELNPLDKLGMQDYLQKKEEQLRCLGQKLAENKYYSCWGRPIMG